MADNPNLVLQVRIEDGLSPFLKAFNDAHLLGGGAPQLPTDAVRVEQSAYRGGGAIRLLPSSALLRWMGDVVARHEVHQGERAARMAASLTAEGSPK